MKRVLLTLTIFLSFIGVVSASTTGTVYCPDNDEPVNLRPSVTSPANNSLVCNSTVEVLDTNAGTNPSSGCTTSFYKVRQGVLTGYACGDFIKVNLPSTIEKGKVLCIEDTSPLYMYRDLNRTDKINNGGLSCNTEVEVLDKNAGKDGKGTCPTSLYKVKYGNTTGYVCGKYIGSSDSNINLDTTDLKEYRANLKKSGFPESYLDDLVKLHALYPKWKFIPFNTNLDFNYIVNLEHKSSGRSLIEDCYGNLDGLKSTASWSYNYFTNVFSTNFTGGGSRWYAASTSTIAYYIDPRNFFNERNIFMFEDLSYNPSFHTREGIENMLKGTFMSGKTASSDGKTYVDAFIEAANTYHISPYVLISRVIQEVGASGSTIVSGTVAGYEGYYNFYNIGATAAGGDKNQTIINGLIYAKNQGWNSPYKAVVGGASFLSNNYVNVGQKTEYLQKWDLIGPSYADHQYMQNIQAPYSQSYKTYNGYNSTNLLNSSFAFYIPIFNNMPDKVAFPNTGNPNNYLSSLTVNKTRLFSSPTNDTNFSIEVESDVSSVTVDATKVYNGATISGLGTVALNSEKTNINLTVTAANGDTRKYTINVTRKKAPEPTPDPKPTPDPGDNTKVTTKEVLDKAGIKYKDNYLYGFTLGKDINDTISKLKSTNLEITITSSKESGLIASGDKIKIKTNSEEKEYIVIIYGDVNGDGKISSADYIKIKNHIMETNKLTDLEKEYADANKDGKVSSADYIAIKNHIMEVSKIIQ